MLTVVFSELEDSRERIGACRRTWSAEARRKLNENRSETECLPRAEARWSATSAERAIEPLWERRYTTPPNSETNATRSEVTVALAERRVRGAPLRKSAQECNFIRAYSDGVFWIRIRGPGQRNGKQSYKSRLRFHYTQSASGVLRTPAYGLKNVGR